MSLWQEPVVEIFVRGFLVLLFGGAALSKLRRGEEFFGVVRNFRILPERLVRPCAVTLPWAELAIAAALLIDATAPYAALAAGALLTVFGVAIGINVLRGRKAIDCGCFRNGLKQPLSWTLVGRNLLLAGASFALATNLPSSRGPELAELAIGAAAASLAMLLYFSASLLAALPAAPGPAARGALKG